MSSEEPEKSTISEPLPSKEHEENGKLEESIEDDKVVEESSSDSLQESPEGNKAQTEEKQREEVHSGEEQDGDQKLMVSEEPEKSAVSKPLSSEEHVEEEKGNPKEDTEEERTAEDSVQENEAPAEEKAGDGEEEDGRRKLTADDLKTAPMDFRFPTTNQARHCFTRYVEYHKCVGSKGEEASECDRYKSWYQSLCPDEWTERWDEQRENGTFSGPL